MDNMELIQYGNESNKILVIDKLHPSPQSLVEKACETPAFQEQNSDYYPGKRKQLNSDYVSFLLSDLVSIIQEQYEIDQEKKAKVSLCAFSITTTPEKKLRPIQCLPHIDNHDGFQFAMVHYLCDEKFGGTSFFRHKSTGYESIDSERLQPYFKLLKEEAIKHRIGGAYISGSNAIFEKIESVPLRFNRIVIYPGNLLHSGDIDPGISLSDDPKLGRLTLNTFVNFS